MPQRLSFVGYVIINAFVIMLCVGIWLTIRYGWWEPHIGPLISTTGMVPLLVFVPMVFIAVSLYDAVFDRYVRRREPRRRPSPPGARTPSRHGD